MTLRPTRPVAKPAQSPGTDHDLHSPERRPQYADILVRNPELTKGGVAAELGVSRLRLYQMLNVLRLPHPLLEFILSNDTPEARELLTERRLRPLTQAKDASQQLALFRQLLQETGLASACEVHG